VVHRIDVCNRALRNELLTNSTLLALLADEAWGYKIFAESPPPNVIQPYVVLQHLYGGMTNDTPASDLDVVYRIVAIGKTYPSALSIAREFDETLAGAVLTFTNNWYGWTGVTNTGDIADQSNVQNTQFWQVGGYYRIRAIKH